MRRKDKEITDRQAMEEIIRAAQVCRLAMTDGDMPYVVPLNFGFTGETLYFHSAGEGLKLDILARNNRVCFLFDIDHLLARGEQACDWGMRYRSVIGFGRSSMVEDREEKRLALAAIMQQYGAAETTFPDKTLADTTVFKVTIETMSGKQSGY